MPLLRMSTDKNKSVRSRPASSSRRLNFDTRIVMVVTVGLLSCSNVSSLRRSMMKYNVKFR
jgi:hypothetical protein